MRIFIIIVLSLISNKIFSQEGIVSNSIKLSGGQWSICQNENFKESFECDNGLMTYDFFENGRFIRNKYFVSNIDSCVICHGSWKLNGDYLTITPDTAANIYLGPSTHQIIIINKDKFYEKGLNDTRSGPIFTYWQRH